MRQLPVPVPVRLRLGHPVEVCLLRGLISQTSTTKKVGRVAWAEIEVEVETDVRRRRRRSTGGRRTCFRRSRR